MLQGLYAASSGMEAQQNQFNAISNDLANINTPGYQSTEVGFEDLLYGSGGVSTGSQVDAGSGSASAIIGRSQAAGRAAEHRPAAGCRDRGRGLPAGAPPRRLHRPDPQRRAAAGLPAATSQPAGRRLVPPISVPPGTAEDQIAISGNGDVTVDKRTVGKIARGQRAGARQTAGQTGRRLYRVTAGSGAARPAAGAKLQQGALEASNVDIAQSDGRHDQRRTQLSDVKPGGPVSGPDAGDRQPAT